MSSKLAIELAGQLSVSADQAKQTLAAFEREAQETAQRIQQAVSVTPSFSIDLRHLKEANWLLEDQQRQAVKIQTAFSGGVGSGTGVPSSLTGPSGSWRRAQQDHHVQLKEQARIYKDLHEQVTKHEAALRSLHGEERRGSEQALADLTKRRDAQREIIKTLGDKIIASRAQSAPEELPASSSGMLRASVWTAILAEVRKAPPMSAQQALSGGGITQALSALGMLAMRHPLISIPAVLTGGALWAEGKASDATRYSEDIEIAFANTGRRTGQGVNLRRTFEPRPGRVRPEFERLGYAGEDVAKIVSAYGMPASLPSLLRATAAQARFARAYGFGDTPEMIAGMGRQVTQWGAAEPGQQGQFWAMLAAAVEKGMKQGVDASETMKGLLALTAKSADQLGVVSSEYVAGLGALQALLAGGESRFFKGERGSQQMANLLDAFQRPRTIQAQAMLMNTMREYFGGVPSAKELGLTGYRAKAYEALPDVDKFQFIQEQLPGLLANPRASQRAQQALTGLIAGVGQGVSPQHAQLLLHALTGMDPSKRVEMQGALFESVVKTGKVSREAAMQMDWPELFSTLTRLAPKEAHRLAAGITPSGELTTPERLRGQEKATMETFSAAVAEASVGLREFTKDAKLAAASWLAAATGRSIPDLNADRLGRIAREASVPTPALRGLLGSRFDEEPLSDDDLRRYAARLKHLQAELSPALRRQFDEEMAAAEKHHRTPTPQALDWWEQLAQEPKGHAQRFDLLDRDERARARRMSFDPGERGAMRLEHSPLRVEITGALTVSNGSEQVPIPGAQLTDLVVRLLNQQAMPVAIGPTRPGWSEVMV